MGAGQAMARSNAYSNSGAASESSSYSSAVASLRNSGNSSASASLRNSGNSRTTVIDNVDTAPASEGGAGAGDPGAGDPGGHVGNGGIGSNIHNTPDIALGNYAGAANNCGIGGGIGGSGPGFGVSAMWSGESHDCRTQSWYIALRVTAENERAMNPRLSAMYEQAARGLACQNEDIAKTAPPGFCLPPAGVSEAVPGEQIAEPVTATAYAVSSQPQFPPPPNFTADCTYWRGWVPYNAYYHNTTPLGHPECGAP